MLQHGSDSAELHGIGPTLMIEVMKSPFVAHAEWGFDGGPPSTPPTDPNDSARNVVEEGALVEEPVVAWPEEGSAKSEDFGGSLEDLLRQVDHLSEADISQYVSYFLKEAYTDVQSVREAVLNPDEWGELKIPLRIKAALRRLLMPDPPRPEGLLDKSGMEHEDVACTPPPKGLKKMQCASSKKVDGKKRNHVDLLAANLTGHGLHSDRAGADGPEITTVDSLDADEGQARDIFVGDFQQGGNKTGEVAQYFSSLTNEVIRYFSKFGSVARVENGYMLVRFVEDDAAQSVLACQDHSIDNRWVNVYPCL